MPQLPTHSPLSRHGRLARVSAYLREGHWLYHLDQQCPQLTLPRVRRHNEAHESGQEPVRRVDVAFLERAGNVHPCRTCALQRVLTLALDAEVQVGAFVTFTCKTGTAEAVAAAERRALRSLARLPMLDLVETSAGPAVYGVVEEGLLRTLARAFRMWRGPLSGTVVGENTVRAFWTLLEDRRAHQASFDAGEVDELWELAELVSAPALGANVAPYRRERAGLDSDELERAEARLRSLEAGGSLPSEE